MAQTALVTGSSRGIGLEFCTQLQQRGFDVIATCRKATPALKALGVEVIENVEVSDPDSLHQLVATLDGRKIDWLINNAGIAGGLGLNDINTSSIESFKRMFEVNSLGPLLSMAYSNGWTNWIYQTQVPSGIPMAKSCLGE